MTIAVCDSSTLFTGRFIDEVRKIDQTISVVVFNEYNALLGAEDLSLFDSFFVATEINCQSGVDVALELYSKNPRAEIVFITENCEKYCQHIFDYADRFRPFAMLSKPVSRMFIRHVLEMLMRVTETRSSRTIVVRLADKDYISLNTSEIVYIQHNNRVSYIYTAGGDCHASKHGISWFEDKLPDCFLHCAKSCIVNALKVREIDGMEIRLSDDISVWCSRQYRKIFVEGYEKYRVLEAAGQ